MNEFYTRITQTSGKPRYEITFSTDDRRYFDTVEEACRECIDKTGTSAPPKYVNTKITNDETFDIVDAFMHLLWGRKVRRTTWSKDEWIKIKLNAKVDCTVIVNEKDIIMSGDIIYGETAIEARWEDYKEE